MKYEAKTLGPHIAVSQAALVPWRSIDRQLAGVDNDAEEACLNIVGTALVDVSIDNHFYLINNNQWQTITRNIEADTRNKSGSEYNRGHTANTPAAYLAADALDSNFCSGLTAIGPDCGGNWHANKRTHSLTNDEIIWDLSGNLWEFVIDDVGSLATEIEPSPDLSSIGSATEYTAAICGAGTDLCFSDVNRMIFGPLDDTLTSANGIGGLSGGQDGTYGGAILRGASRNVSTGGMHHIDLDYPVDAAGDTGFRCAWSP